MNERALLIKKGEKTAIQFKHLRGPENLSAFHRQAPGRSAWLGVSAGTLPMSPWGPSAQCCSHQLWVLLLGWKQVCGCQVLHLNMQEGPTWTSVGTGHLHRLECIYWEDAPGVTFPCTVYRRLQMLREAASEGKTAAP